ncbi:MAG: hypothetical protein M1818_002402 [Claussenomyces sp. TS43310]|nr:MAG: hypothetical protein M1818_002402 [Claussenomyces sp. TS43310]
MFEQLNMMFTAPSATTDSDESAIDPSTAPTTPDESLSFSPVLQAAHLPDALDGVMPAGAEARLGEGFSATLDLNGAATPMLVRNICCVGAGYVVIAFQNPSIRVNVVDRDAARIASWNSKHLPIHENGLDKIVRIARDGSKATSFVNAPATTSNDRSSKSRGDEQRDEISIPARISNLFFSTEVAKCVGEADIILITVNTPTKKRGMGAGSATDVTALEGATREIALHARPGAILVEKSTVPCGTAQLIQDTLQVHRPGVQFEILSNPEFLAEGTAVKDLLAPDRVIIGSADTISGRRAAATLAEVYSAWVPRSRIKTINLWSSELSKLVANAMLAQRISSINSISAICEKTGADIEEIALSIGLDPRIGPQYLKSSLGFGGSCFKKDILSLIYLAQSLGLDEVGAYWQQVLALNDFQRNRFALRIIRSLNNTLVRKKITLLGYAFKKDTSDTRESPAVDIIKHLLNDGPSEIAIYDPCCNPKMVKEEVQQLLGSADVRLLKEEGGPVEVYTDAYAACRDANAVAILTEWDEFRNGPLPGKLACNGNGNGFKTSKPSKASIPDPRPFQMPEPSESELLALHDHLVSQLAPPIAATNDTAAGDRDASNPLDRYLDEPACNEACSECRRVGAAYNKAGEQLNWIRVARSLRSPKWVFDGRGIIDVPAMESLGVRVEAIGKVGRRL